LDSRHAGHDRSLASDLRTDERAWKDGTATEREHAEHAGYRDWRSVEIVIKDAAKNTAHQAGADISTASVSAQIQQARFDRFFYRAFAAGERSEWLEPCLLVTPLDCAEAR
jgi:hypothetical protein